MNCFALVCHFHNFIIRAYFGKHDQSINTLETSHFCDHIRMKCPCDYSVIFILCNLRVFYRICNRISSSLVESCCNLTLVITN